MLLQVNIAVFRVIQMIQDKTQFEENGESSIEGRSASMTATPYWVIWITPFGRDVKRSFALLGFGEELSLLARAGYYLRASPSGQTLIVSLNTTILS